MCYYEYMLFGNRKMHLKKQANESTEYLIKSKDFFFCIDVSSSTLLTDLSWMMYDRLFYMTKSWSGKIIFSFHASW